MMWHVLITLTYGWRNYKNKITGDKYYTTKGNDQSIHKKWQMAVVK